MCIVRILSNVMLFLYRSCLLKIKDSWFLSPEMEIFSALLNLYEGNLLVTGGFPSQRPATRSFDAFFYLRLNKRLTKQLRCRWFETPSPLLWRHCNVFRINKYIPSPNNHIFAPKHKILFTRDRSKVTKTLCLFYPHTSMKLFLL